jgi:hypothetical protein
MADYFFVGKKKRPAEALFFLAKKGRHDKTCNE